MPLPLFFPVPRRVGYLALKHPITLRALCAQADAPCRASGAWTEQEIELVESSAPFIDAEAGQQGRVRIGVKPSLCARDRARYALGALSYALMNGVARQSIHGAAWAGVDRRGRPAGIAKPNHVRQREFRARKA